MTIQASGRATFNKVVDGVSSTFTLVPTYGTQIKSKDPVSYTPNFATNNNIVTPTLKILGIGDTSNQVKGTCTWSVVCGGKTLTKDTDYTVETSGAYRLIIKKNLPSSALVTCVYKWTHPTTGQTIDFTATLPIPVAENAGTMIMALITPKSTDRYQTTAGGEQWLDFEGAMIRGGAEDTTDVAYKWKIFDPKVGDFLDFDSKGQIVVPTGKTAGLPTGVTLAKFGANNKTISVSDKAVINVGSIKLTVRDTDANSSTSGKEAVAVKGLIDDTDPIDLELAQPKGPNVVAGGGNPMRFDISQGNYEWTDKDYIGKKLGFYRLTAAGAKDSSFAPSAADFGSNNEWAVANNEVSRSYTTTATGTEANRTVVIKYSHLIANAVQTTFQGYLDY